jgi:superfamily II DNA or RNA helicase
VKREKVSKFRVNLGKQVSIISPPKKFAFTDFFSISPDLWDLTDALILTEGINIHGGEARILQPSLDVATSIIPLQAYVSSLELYPTIDLKLSVVDFYFQPVDSDLYDYTIINTLSNPTILNVAISLDKIGIFGMNYSDKHWHKISYPEEETNLQSKRTKSGIQEWVGNTTEPQKRRRKSKNQQPDFSIWDLLFAVLQPPPIILGQSENFSLYSQLYPYQGQGIKFLIDNEHALLADDMGTGKTVMTIVALKILIQQANVHHVLILCPPSVLYEWKNHLENWSPELTAYPIRSPKKEDRKILWKTPMHVYVTTYDMFRSDIENDIFPKESLNKFDVVVLDEAHHIKNPKTKIHRAISKLRPRRRWALTGTPMQNKVEDLAAIFDFVYPGFITQYDLSYGRIQEKIKPYFLRRRKQEVMPELPPKIHETIELELDEEQEIEYRQAEANIHEEFNKMLANGEKITKQHIFAKIMKLKQICNFASRKLSSPKTESLKLRIEEIIESGKEENIESGNKVIVFSQFVGEGVSKLEKLLEPYGVARIIGGQADSVRRIEIERFKKRKDIPILIASLRSGGEGLNLTEASYVVHFDHWWNPAVMWQAEDRVHRRGQTRGVNIYSYWMKDTIDDRIRQKLREKRIQFENIIDGMAEERIDELFTTDEWLEILGVKKVEVSKKPRFDTKVWQTMSLSEIREKLYEVTPLDFELLVKELMLSLNYENAKVTGRSHDGGIDVSSTRITANGVERVVAQCKRYRGSVPVNVAREFFGSITAKESIKQGFLVTTGEFTTECLRFCEECGVITAISGLEFAKYVRQFGLSY